MRHLRGLSLRCARHALWLGGLFIAANTVMTLLAAGQYALAVVAFVLAIGGLAAARSGPSCSRSRRRQGQRECRQVDSGTVAEPTVAGPRIPVGCTWTGSPVLRPGPGGAPGPVAPGAPATLPEVWSGLMPQPASFSVRAP